MLLEWQGTRKDVAVSFLGNSRYRVAFDEQAVEVSIMAAQGTEVRFQTLDTRSTANVLSEATRVSVFLSGQSFAFDVPDVLASAAEDGAGGDVVAAPMPGLVRAVMTHVGAEVAQGDPLLVLEAMKMEHTLRAPRDGVVAELLAAVGDQVSDGTILLALEPSND